MNGLKNESMNELIKIDSEGRTTARALYEFLKLNWANYARWCRMNIIQNVYATEGVDWWGSSCVMNGNETMDYLLTIGLAKKLCMLSPTERGNQARDYFVEVESRYKNQIAPTDPLDLIIRQATMMKELRQQQQAQELAQLEQAKEIKRLAAKLETSLKEYFTIAGFASLRGVRVDVNRASMLGRKAVFLSREYNYDVGKTHDPRFGQVNTYHSDILAEVFAAK